MKQLYSARNGFEAHEVRLFLESQGIEAKVFGDNNALEIGFAFTPASAPGVFVNEADFDRAEELLEGFQTRDRMPVAHDTWICSNCNETVESQFDLCWNCESSRNEASIPASVDNESETVSTSNTNTAAIEAAAPIAKSEFADGEGPSNRDLWLEVSVVLALTWLPYFASCIIQWIWPDPLREQSFMGQSVWDIITYLVNSAVVLYIIHRGHAPWRLHGIRKPRMFTDLSLGVSIWIAMMAVEILVLRFVVSIVGVDKAREMTTSIDVFTRPSTGADFVVLVLLVISIGFSEELAMRGYLIPRFEQLLGSTPKSILLSSLLFASYHLYQGVGSAMMILVVGTVFGIAFCWSRRLWPVVIAHAAMDLFALS